MRSMILALFVAFACIINCNAFFGAWGGGLGGAGLAPYGGLGGAFGQPAVGPAFNFAPNGYAQTFWNNHYYPYYQAGYATHALGK